MSRAPVPALGQAGPVPPTQTVSKPAPSLGPYNAMSRSDRKPVLGLLLSAHRRHASALVATAIAGAMVLLLAGCGPKSAKVLALSGATMGTTYSVQVLPPRADVDPNALQQRIDALLAKVNALMSTYDPDSELSRFNAAQSTDWFAVSPALVKLVDVARQVSEASDGAFDITVGPLVNLWGFGPELRPDALPAQTDIDAARARVGYHKLHTRAEPPALRKDRPDLYVDLSAIAKGYGVDRVAALLESEGLTDYLVEIGGELRGRGVNGRGEPWRIAVERPEAGRRSVFRIVPLHDLGMATSGDYRNFFEVNGERYPHSIDPRTGWPVQHPLASVTVLADDCMWADAWATALLVLGTETGHALAESRGLAALFISRIRARGTRGAEDQYPAQATAAFEHAAEDATQ